MGVERHGGIGMGLAMTVIKGGGVASIAETLPYGLRRVFGWGALGVVGYGLGWMVVHGWSIIPFALIVLLLLLAIPLSALFTLFFCAAMLTRVVWHFGGITIRPDQLLLLPLLVRVLLPTKGGSRGSVPRVVWVILLLTGAWWGTGLASSLILSINPGYSLRDVAWIFLSLTSGLTAFVAVKKGLITLGMLFSIMRWALLGAVCYGLIAYALHVFAHTTFGVQLNPLTQHYEIYGPALEANIYGSVAALSLFLWWPAADDRSPYRYVGVALSVLGVIFCVTRGVWLAVAFSGLLLWVTGRIKVHPGLFIVGVVPFVVTPVLRRQFGHISGQSIDLHLRLTSASQVLFQWSHGGLIHMMFGFGVNTWGLTHVAFGLGQTIPAWLGGQVFQTLYDTGAIGLAFLVASVTVLLRALWPMDKNIWAVRLLGAFVALAISYEDTTALWFSFTWLVGMMGVLAVDSRYSMVAYGRGSSNREEDSERNRCADRHEQGGSPP